MHTHIHIPTHMHTPSTFRWHAHVHEYPYSECLCLCTCTCQHLSLSHTHCHAHARSYGAETTGHDACPPLHYFPSPGVGRRGEGMDLVRRTLSAFVVMCGVRPPSSHPASIPYRVHASSHRDLHPTSLPSSQPSCALPSFLNQASFLHPPTHSISYPPARPPPSCLISSRFSLCTGAYSLR